MKEIADVLAAHWSRSTHSDSEPFVDKCDGCGAVIYTWGGDPTPEGIEPLAAHQAEALAVVVREKHAVALEEAADERAVRSETFLTTMQNMADTKEYELADIVRYGAYSAEAMTTSTWLRGRAAELRKP